MLMTRLELCQRLRSECVGVSGSGPTSTLNQSGDMLRVVNWIDSAYEDIQNLDPRWNFLRKTFSFNTVAAQQGYTQTQAGAADQGTWKLDHVKSYLTSEGSAGEIIMSAPDWESFYQVYMLGATRTQTGRPLVVTEKPDRSLALWPIPDAIYTVTGEYWRAPHQMTADAHVPILPEQFHMLIVWRALVFYAGHAAAPETFTVGQAEHKRLLSMLRRHQLPPVQWA